MDAVRRVIGRCALKITQPRRFEQAPRQKLGGVERHGLEAVAAFDAIVLTWGVPGQGAIRSCLLQFTWSVRFRSFGLCRRLSVSRLWLLASEDGERATRVKDAKHRRSRRVRSAHVLGELVGVREALGEARARADAAEARSAELSSDLAAERARTETSIAALSALADKLDELVADQRRPWWRRLAKAL